MRIKQRILRRLFRYFDYYEFSIAESINIGRSYAFRSTDYDK